MFLFLEAFGELGHKVALFTWTATLDKISILIMGYYCMCMNSGETVEHFLLHCLVAREVCFSCVCFIWSILGYTKDDSSNVTRKIQ